MSTLKVKPETSRYENRAQFGTSIGLLTYVKHLGVMVHAHCGCGGSTLNHLLLP